MSTHLDALPAGYFSCRWCGGGVRFLPDGGWPTRCPHCNMHPHPSEVDETVGGKVDPGLAAAAKRNRRSAPRKHALDLTPVGQPVLGVDPGARYTGVVLRDGDAVLHSSTLVRPKDLRNPVQWALTVAAEVQRIYLSCPPNTQVAAEGVEAPKGFKDGKRQPIDPGPILFSGVVLGAVAQAFPDLVIIKPGGNGSGHITNYPPALVGRRPTDLPGSTNGAGTRDHEQSAYDVAGKAAKLLYPRAPLITSFAS